MKDLKAAKLSCLKILNQILLVQFMKIWRQNHNQNVCLRVLKVRIWGSQPANFQNKGGIHLLHSNTQGKTGTKICKSFCGPVPSRPISTSQPARQEKYLDTFKLRNLDFKGQQARPAQIPWQVFKEDFDGEDYDSLKCCACLSGSNLFQTIM